jgi:hypothetical protein
MVCSRSLTLICLMSEMAIMWAGYQNFRSFTTIED